MDDPTDISFKDEPVIERDSLTNNLIVLSQPQHFGDVLISGNEVTDQVDELASNDQDEEASQLYRLANSTLAEFQDTASLSSLDTAIFLFREALNRHPEPVLRSESLNDLAMALVMRASHTNQGGDLEEALALQASLQGGQTELDSGRPMDLDAAISMHRAALELLSTSNPDRCFALGDLAIALIRRFQVSGRCEDLEEGVSFHRDALKLRPAPHPDRYAALNDLATSLYVLFEHSGRHEDLEELILLLREALELPSTPRPSILSNLACALKERFEQSGQRKDLEDAISFHRDALELRPPSHPDRSDSLNNLAETLVTRFKQSGQREDLEEAISLHRNALELRPAPHPHRTFSLSNLAAALMRLELSGEHEDLEEAISLHREALQLRPSPHSHRSAALDALSTALFTRFEQSGQRKDLEEGILLARDTLKLRPAPHPLRSNTLHNLAVALMRQFEQSCECDALDEAISLHRAALQLRPAPHPERSNTLCTLATTLTRRFGQLGQREDLDEGILLHRDAIELRPFPHPDRPASLEGLATSMILLFEQSGRREDLEKAISMFRDTHELQPAQHQDRSSSLNKLANALRTRFNLSGRRGDLDEAISLHRDALEMRPATHPDRFLSLHNLAIALMTRFEQSGGHEDLEEAVALHRDALELQPPHHPDRSAVLGGLAGALITRFQEAGHGEDLEGAISLHRDALELRGAPHAHRSRHLNDLSNALLVAFEQSGELDYIEEAISLHRDALKLRPEPHLERPTSLGNLARALMTRFKQSHRRDDLEEAINAYHESLNALVSGHPEICSASTNLGQAYMQAYDQTQETEYMDKAMRSFQVAVTCESASASARFNSARLWATHADSRHDSALEAFHAAIQLLPRLAMLSLDLPSRQQALTSGTDGLARHAAACAIRSGQYGKAVELLEEGRAVFWSQALQLRTPMAELRDVAPQLEEKLRHIALALEQGSLRDVSKHSSTDTHKVMSLEREASHFRVLNEEWLLMLEEVRQLDGFQDFLRPSRLSTLLGAAAKGPVVILNASVSGCSALVLTSGSVHHVPLSALSFNDVIRLVELMRIATGPGGRESSSTESVDLQVEVLLRQMPPLSASVQLLRRILERRDLTRVPLHERHVDIIPYVLSLLWGSVVKPVVDFLDLQKSDVPPNLWWCPTGPFSFLPIHAAGVYGTAEPACVADYVVSSYTPTIKTLLRDGSLPDSFKMMVVIQPLTPGQMPLPYTIDELQRIQAHVPTEGLVSLVSGTVKDVTFHLPNTSVAHFACHGQQNAHSPLESALILQDGPLRISKIMQQSIPNASLAFLSACETAKGDRSLPDEVVHLGSTLLFAGFQGVVGTLWTMSDQDGPKVADTFYEYLLRGSTSTPVEGFHPDTTQAARALHLAVAKLRSENVPFIRWVPFIHLGR